MLYYTIINDEDHFNYLRKVMSSIPINYSDVLDYVGIMGIYYSLSPIESSKMYKYEGWDRLRDCDVHPKSTYTRLDIIPKVLLPDRLFEF